LRQFFENFGSFACQLTLFKPKLGKPKNYLGNITLGIFASAVNRYCCLVDQPIKIFK